MNAQVQQAVRTYLRTNGFPPHFVGTPYIRQILEQSVTAALEGRVWRWRAMDLYHAIAARNETTPPRVERGIRHAREKAGITFPNMRFLADASDQIVGALADATDKAATS
ncbi:sporulation initiation factor Spo0A C-terminal domain-containing protein [Sulfobacillus harzensis]|uniref:Sporulation initiation factor Spo0A C-terminal domain-containing protein n=1 Tax=Sulfobacillus harzensis TaxID=2729629 RepID=A0A7Y0Q3W8_9FIRM|nr:sporulation initiation factor Spo0A C-terminal domain-containing protein [Sulfobacillus harzensis]NMP23416.1 hypothetical protein [Sulfobacillus harzensis]